MYYHNRTAGKYFLVPVYMKAYYFNRGATQPMALMPRGLRMIRGDPYRTVPLVPEHEIRNDTVNVFWMGSNMTGGFPAWTDQGDWQTRTMFPNCWDGKNLVTETPLQNTHMVFIDPRLDLSIPTLLPRRAPKCPGEHPPHSAQYRRCGFLDVKSETRRHLNFGNGAGKISGASAAG